jgi:large subunit ribosomal protein L10
MGMDRATKEVELEHLASAWQGSALAVCADYRGLTVSQISDLRAQLRQVGATAKVVKNTLARISAEKALAEADSAQVGKLMDVFQGPSFLVFSNDDVVSPAKVLAKFSKDHEVFQVKGGWFEGMYLDQAGVVQVSNMPSREELLAKLLYLLNAPATQLARVVNAPAQQLAQVINAYKDTLTE